MSRLAMLALALALTCASARARAQCTPADFGKEIIAGLPGAACPRPADAELEALIERIDRTVADPRLRAVERADVLLATLRELRERYGPRPEWGAGFARGIDAMLFKAGEGQPAPSGFANVRAANTPPDPACTLVTGTHGESDYACFVLEGQPIPAPPSDGTRVTVHVLEPAEAALAHRVLSAAHSAISKLNLPELDEAIARLTQARRRFDNLRKHGYLQYPWELLLDGALAPRARSEACQARDSFCNGESGLDPASVRSILLHPGVGLAASGLGWNGAPSSDTAIALSLEAIGFVSYTESFEHYWGLSAGAIVNDGDFGDTRFGVFIHGTRWVHAGYLLSVLRDSTRGDASVFLSMDLGTAFGASFLE